MSSSLHISLSVGVFIFAARRGLAPLVACVDCGHIFRCPDTGAPYSLLKIGAGDDEKRFFVSPASGKRIPAADTCPHCGSWRLKERGVGIQHIENELRSQFPEIPIILFDHTTATTHRKAIRLMAEFYDTKGAVLLGTAMALPYIEKPNQLTVVTSLEALRANPSWRAEEELLAQLLHLRTITDETVMLQTRAEPDDLLKYAKSGAVSSFYDEEIDLREQLTYPPFATFIHLTVVGTEEQNQTQQNDIETLLPQHKIHFYPGPPSNKKKTLHGLLRVPQSDWPNQDLVDRLRSLPPSVRIEINPERIV